MSFAQKRRRKLRHDAAERAAADHDRTLDIPFEKWVEAARLHAAPRTLSDGEAAEIGTVLRKFALDWTSKPYFYDGR